MRMLYRCQPYPARGLLAGLLTDRGETKPQGRLIDFAAEGISSE